jgi:hypothetical protein
VVAFLLAFPPITSTRSSSPAFVLHALLISSPWLHRSNYTCWGVHFMKLGICKKKTPWSDSASELYRPSDRRLSAKRLPTCADRGCHVVSVTDPSDRILGFLYRSRYFSIK